MTVTALTSAGATASSYLGTIQFSSSDVLAGLPANYTFTAADHGSHTFTGLIKLDTAGSQSLSATDTSTGNITGTTSISVSAGVATHLVFLQQPSSATVGAAISPAVTVKVEDAFNNVLTGDSTDQVTVGLGTNPSGATLSGTTTATVSAGVATFSNLSINLAGTGYTLLASSPATASGATSTAFNVSAAASSSLIEGFESSVTYHVVGANSASASISTVAAHDGTYGLVDSNGSDWIYRNDAAAQVKQGESITVWLQFSGTADGRAYFGFGASAAGALSLVAAPNTKQLILQSNSGYGYTDLAAVNQSWQANHWYKLEVDWGTNGAITGKVFDSNGTTLLQSVTTTNTSVTAGGIAFRAIGSNKFWDTVNESPLASGSTRSAIGQTTGSTAITASTNPVAASTFGSIYGSTWLESLSTGIAAASGAQSTTTFASSLNPTTSSTLREGSLLPTIDELLLEESTLQSIAHATASCAANQIVASRDFFLQRAICNSNFLGC